MVYILDIIYIGLLYLVSHHSTSLKSRFIEAERVSKVLHQYYIQTQVAINITT